MGAPGAGGSGLLLRYGWQCSAAPASCCCQQTDAGGQGLLWAVKGLRQVLLMFCFACLAAPTGGSKPLQSADCLLWHLCWLFLGAPLELAVLGVMLARGWGRRLFVQG